MRISDWSSDVCSSDLDRPLARAHPFERRLGRAAHRENVHAVDLHAGDAEAFAAAIELVLGATAIDRSAHRILVVLDHEDVRQLPQLGDVEAFIDLALVRGAVAEIGHGDPAVAAIFVREGEAGAERDLSTDDAVAAIEFMLDAEHVHRAALALRDARLTPGQLGHDDLGVDAVSEHMPVVAIAGDHAVTLAVACRLEAHGDRFLAAIAVADTADQAR